MSQVLLNLIAKKALKDVASKNINTKDPFFEEVEVYGRDGRATGKVKKQKKALPHGLSQNDASVLKKVRRRAYRLDMSLFNLCGIKFGWSSVIGIIPVIGDVIDMLLALLLVRAANQVDGNLPPLIKSRMYFNCILDFGIGLVPFAGDLADAIFRANTRNCWILEEYLVKKAEEERKIAAGTSNLVQEANANGANIPTHAQATSGNGVGTAQPVRPEHAKQQSGVMGGLFGSRSRRADEEMGMSSVPPNLTNQQKPTR